MSHPCEGCCLGGQLHAVIFFLPKFSYLYFSLIDLFPSSLCALSIISFPFFSYQYLHRHSRTVATRSQILPVLMVCLMVKCAYDEAVLSTAALASRTDMHAYNPWLRFGTVFAAYGLISLCFVFAVWALIYLCLLACIAEGK